MSREGGSRLIAHHRLDQWGHGVVALASICRLAQRLDVRAGDDKNEIIPGRRSARRQKQRRRVVVRSTVFHLRAAFQQRARHRHGTALRRRVQRRGSSPSREPTRRG